jgi:hypothetical protein
VRRSAPFLALLVAACGPATSGRATKAVEIPVDLAALEPESQFLSEIDKSMGVRDCFISSCCAIRRSRPRPTRRG